MTMKFGQLVQHVSASLLALSLHVPNDDMMTSQRISKKHTSQRAMTLKFGQFGARCQYKSTDIVFTVCKLGKNKLSSQFAKLGRINEIKKNTHHLVAVECLESSFWKIRCEDSRYLL